MKLTIARQARLVIRNEVENWLRLLSDSGTSLLRLARAEMMLAATGMPQLIALWLLMVPLILLAWVGFSVLVGWLAWYFSAQVWVGLLAFVLLQLLCCYLVFRRIARIQEEVLFPATRRQLQDLDNAEYGD